MAQKRMFSIQVIDTDRFLDMPLSAQALYFHLGMHGDDDGFVGSPQKIARAAGCNSDDLKLLIAKGYILPFESGVVVITDWNINNTLKNDRYHGTIYTAEKALLTQDCNGRFMLGTNLEPSRNQIGTNLEPEHNVTKHNLTEGNLSDRAGKPPRARFIPPALDEVQAYCSERKNSVDAARFLDFYSANGWVQGKGKPIKDWKAAVRTWERSSFSGAQSAEEQKLWKIDPDTGSWVEE